MSLLGRKRLRDLASHKLALAALLAIIAVGIGVFLGMIGAYRDLDAARRRYYDRQRIADFTVDLKRAPAWVEDELRAMPNVLDVRGRVHLATRVDVAGYDEPVSGVVLSTPAKRAPSVDDAMLRTGTWFSVDDAREVVVNAAFAQAHRLHAGDRLRVLLLDKQHNLLIVGTAMSPEFVYAIPPEGGLVPDPERFAVLYLPRGFARESCDLKGAFNQFVGRVRDRSPGALADTLSLIRRKLDPWGVVNVTSASEQPSVKFVADELTSLKVSATIMPALFLGVAALVLNVLMSRMIRQQRSVIGTLRALGYTRRAIVNHYLGFGVLIGLLGAAGGVVLGLLLQSIFLGMYRQFFAIPHIDTHVHLDAIAVGFAISIVFAVLGTLKSARRAAALDPAEAMRPSPPEQGGAVFVERFSALWAMLSFRAKMSVRAIFRNPFRSSVGVVATLIATALVFATMAIYDAFLYMMNYQFDRVAHQDWSVTLRDPVGRDAVAEVHAIPGVTEVEPQLVVACDFRRGANHKRTGLTGLLPGGELYTPLDEAGRPIVIPREGLVLDRKLASILHAKEGDRVRLRPLIGERREVEAPVVALVEGFLGLNAYADLRYLSRLLGEEWATDDLLASSAFDRLTPVQIADLRKRPAVVGIVERKRSLQKLDETMGQTMGSTLGITILFAGLIAFGSVLNAAMVSLSERRREVATLRTLGYRPAQVAAIFTLESALLNGLGIALGLVAGIGLSSLLSRAYDTELYRFPVVIYPRTLIAAGVAMAAFVALAQLIVYRMIRRLPWLEVLNIKE